MSTDAPSTVKELANRLSHALGVEASIVKEHSTDGDKYAIRLTDTGGKLVPQLKIGRASYELELREPTLPSPIDVVLRVGDVIQDKTWYYYIGCENSVDVVACTSDAIAKRIRESIAGVRLLNELIEKMSENGIQVTGVNCQQICKEFSVSAAYDNISVKVRYSDIEGGYLTVKAVYPTPMTDYLLRSDIATAMRKLFKRNNLKGILIDYLERDAEKQELYVSTVHRHASTVVPFIKTVHDVLNSKDRHIRELLERVSPADALVLYLFCMRGVESFYKAISIVLGTKPDGFLGLRAVDYLVNVVDDTSTAFNLLEDHRMLAKVLFEKGRLTIDSKGYLALDGRRLVSIVEKYVGRLPQADRILFHINMGEKSILTNLLEEANVNIESVYSDGRIPGRLVDVIMRRYELISKYFHVLIKQPVWSELSREARITVLASKPEAVDLARENYYTWVFENPYLVAEALTCSKTPAEATKALLEHFPEFIGSEFKVVHAGGEPFIKLGNVVLQIRKVHNNTVSAHGTISNSRIGVVAKGRSVASVAANIAKHLIDAVIELKEIAGELQSCRHIKLEEYKTPLFTIPVIAVHTWQGTVRKIPLQPGLKTILMKNNIRTDEDRKTDSADSSRTVL